MRLIEKIWFYSHPARWWLVPLLFPLSMAFFCVSYIRKLMYHFGMLKRFNIGVPVVVVGNIGVGGNGKTPVTLFLVQKLQAKGIKVGVVSRGYGSKAPHYPYQVTDDSTAITAGDEPLLIYRRTKAPVVIASDRVAACQQLLAQECQLIIADDGLQHYRLHRDYEIIVVDGKRLFGNGLLLPAGPLREPTSRITQVDCVISNGLVIKQDNLLTQRHLSVIEMQLTAKKLINIRSGISVVITDFLNQHCDEKRQVNALAAIGDPLRFFTTLQSYGFRLNERRALVDHQALSLDELAQFSNDIPLLMTEKDAVKCLEFAGEHCWYLPVDAVFTNDIDTTLVNDILKLVEK